MTRCIGYHRRHWFAYYGRPGSSAPRCQRGCGTGNPNYDRSRDVRVTQEELDLGLQNTRSQRAYAEEGYLALGDIREFVERCVGLSDEARVGVGSSTGNPDQETDLFDLIEAKEVEES